MAALVISAPLEGRKMRGEALLNSQAGRKSLSPPLIWLTLAHFVSVCEQPTEALLHGLVLRRHRLGEKRSAERGDRERQHQGCQIALRVG